MLWQDATTKLFGDIQAADLNSRWANPSTPDALKGADNGTSITSVAPVSSYNVSLGASPGAARCYFTVGFAVREA